ncbi:MAG: glycosyltransferase family 2 protein [Emcibacteraceae bacterium]|nr:glycosyltransferase family 2 protein [Emcibacteraceae bacterium]
MRSLKVSIIIPCYNNDATIMRALESVAQSSYQNLEIFIFDDASTDQSVNKIKEFISKNPNMNVILIESKENKGAGFARNKLLSQAAGQFYAFLDADDYWYEGKLEQQVMAIHEYGLDIVTCSYDIRDEDNNYLGIREVPEKLTYMKMLMANWLPMSMTLVSSDLINASQMPDVRKRQDYAYWLCIFRDNRDLKFGSINNALGCYERRSNSLSSNKVQNLKYNYWVFNKALKMNKILAIILVTLNIVVRMTRT